MSHRIIFSSVEMRENMFRWGIFYRTVKDGMVLSKGPVVLIGQEDQRRAKEFLLQYNSKRVAGQEQAEENITVSGRSLMKKKASTITTKSTKEDKERPISICEYCQKQFNQRSTLLQHLVVHTGQKKHHCHLCAYSTARKSVLRAHIQVHLNERPYKCPENGCDRSYTNSTELKGHQIKHSVLDQKFPCLFCEYKTYSKFALNCHVNNEHPDSGLYKCPQKNCEHSASTRRNLKRHMLVHSPLKKHSHPGLKPTFQDIGNEQRRTAVELLRKSKRGSGQDRVQRNTKTGILIKKKAPTKTTKSTTGRKMKPVYTCVYCEKEFPFASNLKQHLSIHTGQKDFNCHLCEYSATRKAVLEAHIRVHLNERPFQCQHPNCGASYTSSSHLLAHQIKHTTTTDQNYSCLSCDFTTYSNGILIRHLKSTHLASITYKCSYKKCDFSTLRKRYLKTHMRIHSEIKNYICHRLNCKFKSKWAFSLKKHLASHCSGPEDVGNFSQ